MNENAQKYLADRLSIARAGPPRGSNGNWPTQMFDGFTTAIEALRVVNALSQEEADDWTNRILVAIGHEPLEPLPPGSRLQRTVWLDSGDPSPPSPTLVAEFLEFIPAMNPSKPLPFGGRVQILGIERYDSKLAVAWRVAPLPDLESQFAEDLAAHERDTEGLAESERHAMRLRFLHGLDPTGSHAIGVTDDLGTEYRHMGGGWGGGRDERAGRAQFSPAIPAKATRLIVSWGDIDFNISLN